MRRMPSVPSVKMLPLDIRLLNTAAGVCLAVFAGLLLVAVTGWLARQPVFSLKAIEIENDLGHNNALTLRANVAPRLTGNFFTMDLAHARTVFEAVPWVRQAVVRREFPDRLRVQLQEHEAVAFWGAEADARLINSFGEVFEVNQGDVEADDLPLLNGPKGQAALVWQGFQRVAPLLAQLDTSLTRFELTGRGSWRGHLESGALIEMGQGSPRDIESRVRRFVATVAQTSTKYGRDLASADLSYGNGYAVKLRGVTTLVPTGKQDKK